MVLRDVTRKGRGYVMLEAEVLMCHSLSINIGCDSLLTIWKNLPGCQRPWTLI